MPAAPKWIWPLLVVVIGLLVVIGGLVSVLGVGGSILANLAPEGFLSGESEAALTSVRAMGVINGTITVPPILDWVTSNRNHKPAISPALDIVSKGTRGSGKVLAYAPIGGTVTVHPKRPNEGEGYGGYGNYVEITNGEMKVLMGHMDNKSFPLVKNGSVVEAGTPVGYVGTTGNSTGPHIHLEVFKGGVRVNPEPMLPKAGSFQVQEIGSGVVSTPLDRTVSAPKGLRKAMQWLASLTTSVAEAPAKWSGKDTPRLASYEDWKVTIVDLRVDKTALKVTPDARKIAQRLAEVLPGKGNLEIVLVDRICGPMGCFPGRLVSENRIEIDPGHEASKDINAILQQQMQEYAEMILKADEENQPKINWGNLTTASEEQYQKEEKKNAPDELVVYVFTQPGDAGTEIVRPTIERLRFDYPWVGFVYQDVTKPEGARLAASYQVNNTPTTVLARAGKEVWTWEGSIEGLEDLLTINRWLGEQLMASGQIALLGPAGKIPNVTFAGTYGALCRAKGSLGLLGSGSGYPLGSGDRAPECSSEGALELTGRFGKWVGENNSGKVVINTIIPTVYESSDPLIQAIIEETGRRNAQGEHWYVLLDVQKASQFQPVMDKYLTSSTPHVGVIFDLEWFGRTVKVSEVNKMAKEYFTKRESLGLKGLGIVGVWYFNPNTILGDEPVTREWEKDEDLQSYYSTGIVVPIMDGYGGKSGKMSNYNKMLDIFKPSYSGMMGFTWRWGNKYDSAKPKDIFTQEMLFWTQQ